MSRNINKSLLFVCLSFVILASCGSEPPNSSVSSAIFQSKNFPIEPDPQLTPGKVCEHADSYRYNEHIAYCERNVTPSTKVDIMKDYDEQLGYRIRSMDRNDFKIDHYIPLCMGGSNSTLNLWPQHKSVYFKTDPIEEKLCKMMSLGRMKQAEAIQTLKDVKHNLDSAEELDQRLEKEIK